VDGSKILIPILAENKTKEQFEIQTCVYLTFSTPSLALQSVIVLMGDGYQISPDGVQFRKKDARTAPISPIPDKPYLLIKQSGTIFD